MQIDNSSWTSGAGVAQGPRLGRRNERQQEQGGGQGEKLSARSSSPGQPSGLAMGKARVIMGSGGDRAILSQGESSAATAQVDAGQKAVIENINRPGVSGETKAAVADLRDSAEGVRQREAELDADFAKNVRSLAQSFNSKNALNSTSEVEKSEDDSETIIDQMRQDREQTANNVTQAVAPEPADGKQAVLAKGVTPTKESEYPTPTADSAGHVDGYI